MKHSVSGLRIVGLPLLLVAAACAAETPPSPPPLASIAAANTATLHVIRRQAQWRVSAAGVDQGPAWWEEAINFPDGTWQERYAPLGYGESYVNPLPYGSDPNHKPTTVYFVTSFYVTQSQLDSGFLAMRLGAMYDDGFVAYLNGQEIKRASMPGGPVSYGTLALGHEAVNGTLESFDVTQHLDALIAGYNTLAIEVHQSSPSSSDLVFEAELGLDIDWAPPPPSRFGIPRRSTWLYWDQGGDLGTAWRGGSFDDFDWSFGRGPLGYGESYLETTVGYGGNAAAKHITTYFRRQFTVSHPGSVTSIIGELMFDDGVVVYLNGTRIGRDSMPSGTITASTLAFGREAGNTYSVYDWSAQKGLLVAGVNTLAVEVHQQSPSSSDLVFDGAITVTMAPPPAPPPSTIARGSAWKYRDQGGDLGSAWRAPAYDDAAWTSGAGPLGYGESYLATTVSYGSNPAQKPITTYFRKKFVVDVPAGTPVTGLRGELMYDDGAVVYLNGQELARVSMPAGAIGASTLALGHEAGNAYQSFDWSAAAALVVPGENVIAVEVHQQAPSSSDLVFDLALQVTSAPLFHRYPGNPIVVPSGNHQDDTYWRSEYVDSPSVLRNADGSWTLFYTGNEGGPHQQTGRGLSADGISWALDPGPVQWLGPDATVVHDSTQFHAWDTNPHLHGVWHHASTDGVHWSSSVGNSAVDEAIDATVIIDAGVFKMWYLVPGSAFAAVGMGYATSSDGVTWQHHPSLVFGPMGGASVIKDGGMYKMWFTQADGIHYATSPDGLKWTPGGLSLPGALGMWDEHPGRPSVVRDGGVLKMWYGASGGDGIGYATSP